MKKLFSQSYVGLVILCAVPLMLAILVVATDKHNSEQSVTESPTQSHALFSFSDEKQKEYWKEKIKDAGGKEAYEELAEIIAGSAPAQQHAFAHKFGSALYVLEGLSAFYVCGNEFMWGCFHEIVGQAIIDHGLGSTADLKMRCDSLPDSEINGCRHSLGHGLLAYIGYNTEDLTTALEACKKYVPDSYGSPFGGCYYGVFMEFILRGMSGLGAEGYNRMEPTKYYSVCDSVTEEFRPTCAALAIQSWIVSVSDPTFTPQLMSRFGELCQGFSTQKLVDTCYMGIGSHLPMTDMPAEDVITNCKAASPEPRGALLCIVSSVAISRISTSSPVTALCAGLSGESADYCSLYSTGTADYDHLVELRTEHP